MAMLVITISGHILCDWFLPNPNIRQFLKLASPNSWLSRKKWPTAITWILGSATEIHLFSWWKQFSSILINDHEIFINHPSISQHRYFDLCHQHDHRYSWEFRLRICLQVAICSLASGIGEASLLAMASFYEAKARWIFWKRGHLFVAAAIKKID